MSNGNRLSNKQKWKRSGTAGYVSLEVRPPSKSTDPKACSVSLEWIPPGDSGAWEAFQAVQTAVLRCKTDEAAVKFYAALRALAEGWTPA